MNNPLILSGAYNVLSVSDRKLIIENKFDGVHASFLPHQCPHDSIILDSPRGVVTLEALRWCSKQNIAITLLNWNGNLLSTMLPRDTISAKLRIQQYKKCLDSRAKHHIASTILDTKISKSLELLLKLADFYPVLDKEVIKREFEETKAQFKGSSELLTKEGNIAVVYWSNVRKLLDVIAPQLNFTNRNGRVHSWNMSASDPANATFNFAYSVIESEIRKALNSIGLDPSIGYLHEIKTGRDSLVYDIQELYRFVADLSVLQLAQNGLKPSDYLVTENYHYRLKPATAKRLVELIKVNLNTRMPYKGLNSTFQNILFDNVRCLANYLMDKQATLAFNIPEIQLKRNDETELRNKILAITPEQQRKLGLRRNTLWYMQKNIRKGKKIKVYNKVMIKLN